MHRGAFDESLTECSRELNPFGGKILMTSATLGALPFKSSTFYHFFSHPYGENHQLANALKSPQIIFSCQSTDWSEPPVWYIICRKIVLVHFDSLLKYLLKPIAWDRFSVLSPWSWSTWLWTLLSLLLFRHSPGLVQGEKGVQISGTHWHFLWFLSKRLSASFQPFPHQILSWINLADISAKQHSKF